MSTPPLTQAQEMWQRYRNVFGSSEGQLVLGDILSRGHYGTTLDPDSPVIVAEYNFALTIGTLAGVFDQLYSQLGLGLRKEE